MKDLREYEFLWDSPGGYVLLRCGEEPMDLLPVCLRGPNQGESLIISDDRLAAAVMAKMIEMGVPVVGDAELARRLAALPPRPAEPTFACPACGLRLSLA